MIASRCALLSAALAAALLVLPIQADAFGLRTGVHKGYVRIVFDWDAPVAYDARLEGRRLTVSFDRPVEGPLTGPLGYLRDWVEGADVAPDGRTVILNLRRQVRLETFVHKGAVVLDLYGSSRSAPAAATATGGPAIPVRAAVHPGFIRYVFDWNRRIRYDLTRESGGARIRFAEPFTPSLRGIDPVLGRRLAKAPNGMHFDLAPGERVETSRVRNMIVVDVHAPARDAVVAKADVPPPPLPPARPQEAQSAPTDAADSTAVAAEAAPTPLPSWVTEAPVPPAVASGPTPTGGKAPRMVLEEEPTDGGETLAEAAPTPALNEAPATVDLAHLLAGEDTVVLPGTAGARIAMFRRNGAVFILADRGTAPPAAAIEASGLVEEADVLPDAPVALRLVLPEDGGLRLERVGQDWALAPGKMPTGPANAVTPAMASGAAGGELVVPIAGAGSVVALADPETGEQLLVVPVPPPHSGIARLRRLPELEVIPTLRGVAVATLSQVVEVRVTDRDVRIGTGRGLLVSSSARPEGAEVTEGLPLLNLDRVALAEAEASDRIRELRGRVAEASDAGRPQLRLQLAELQLAHGLGREALSEVERAIAEDPDLADRPRIKALRGASALVGGEPAAARRYLSDPALDGAGDLVAWRALATAAERDWDAAASGLRATPTTFAGYPAVIRRELALLAAEAAIEGTQPDVAERLLQMVERAGPLPYEQAEHDFLRARLMLAQGAIEEGANALRALVDNADRRTAARAKLELIRLQQDAGTLSLAEVIEGLEDLRFAWRGDIVERDVLHKLGQSHLEQGDYWRGFGVLKEAVALHPDPVFADAVTTEMQAAFADLFTSDRIGQLSPVKAVALFQEFRELAVPGGETAAALQDLARRLVGIDLLEPAVELLKPALKQPGMDGGDRAAMGADLAAIRLLQSDPGQALQDLVRTESATRDSAVGDRRRLLRARALMAQDRTAEALLTLADDERMEADVLRAQIYADAGDWDAAARQRRELVDALAPEGEPLSPTAARAVLDLAIAYSLSNNRAALTDVSQDYSPRMAETSLASAFRMIISLPDAVLTGLDDLPGGLAEMAVFQDELESYRSNMTAASAPQDPAG